MTNKELEQLLSSLSEFTCPDIDISIHSLADEVLRYIRDLKAEKEQMRKDTAKKILSDLLTLINNNEDFGRGVFGWKTEEIKMLVKLHIKMEYGVEVQK